MPTPHMNVRTTYRHENRSYKEPSALGGLYKIVSRPVQNEESDDDEDSDLEIAAPKRAGGARRGKAQGASQARRGSPASPQLNISSSDSLFGKAHALLIFA